MTLSSSKVLLVHQDLQVLPVPPDPVYHLAQLKAFLLVRQDHLVPQEATGPRENLEYPVQQEEMERPVNQELWERRVNKGYLANLDQRVNVDLWAQQGFQAPKDPVALRGRGVQQVPQDPQDPPDLQDPNSL